MPARPVGDAPAVARPYRMGVDAALPSNHVGATGEFSTPRVDRLNPDVVHPTMRGINQPAVFKPVDQRRLPHLFLDSSGFPVRLAVPDVDGPQVLRPRSVAPERDLSTIG